MHHRDRLTAQTDPVAVHTDLHHTTASRRLIHHEAVGPEALAPERPQTAVGRPGYRVLVDTGGRREEPGDELDERGVAVPGVPGGSFAIIWPGLL